MQRERVTDDVYIFTSELYADVTAGVIVTTEGAVVFDTLAFPEETLAMKRFINERLGLSITYVVNSHFHADHTTGTCFFQGATILAHERCRKLLNERGRKSLESAKNTTPSFEDVELVLPQLVFDSRLTLRCGNKTLQFWSSPGHSSDSIACLIEEDQVLFAADTLMPIPYFVDGNFENLILSLEALRRYRYETAVQGHGEVILRGEIEDKIDSDIRYLRELEKAVDAVLDGPQREQALEKIDISACGKDRILLGGMAEQLHRRNVLALFEDRVERGTAHA